jgi:peptidoglycan hydrolase CwlO-like protein
MFQVLAVEDLDHVEHHKTEMEMESKSLKKQQESMNAIYASMSDELENVTRMQQTLLDESYHLYKQCHGYQQLISGP